MLINRRLIFSVMFTALLAVTGGITPVFAQEDTVTTVVLVRHADRVGFSKELNERGKARAAALPTALQKQSARPT